MNNDFFNELNRTAFDLAHGSEEAVKKLKNMSRFDMRTYILQMASLYQLHESGVLTTEQAKELKIKVIKEYRTIMRDLHFCRVEHNQWLEATKLFSKNYRELSFAIKDKDPKVLEIALNLVDLLSRHFVYKKMYFSLNTGKTYPEDITKLLENSDLTDPEKKDFEQIFYKWLELARDDHTVDVFEPLDDEHLEKLTDFSVLNSEIKAETLSET